MAQFQKANAVRWSFIDVAVRISFQILSTVVLARFLSPADFGAVALIIVLVNFGEIAMQSGFVVALIQRHNSDTLDASTVFWLNIVLGTLITFLFILFAPIFVELLNQNQAEYLLYALSPMILISAIYAVPKALLVRDLAFKSIFGVTFVSAALSSMASVYLAFNNFGLWALVLQTLVMQITTCLGFWYVNSWRPAMQFSSHRAFQLWRSAKFLLMSSFINTLGERISSLSIGLRLSTSDLGYYGRAEQFSLLPAGLLAEGISRVAFPLFVSESKDLTQLLTTARRILRVTALIAAPCMVMFIVASDRIIGLFLGPNWTEVVVIFKVLTVGALLHPFHLLNMQLLLALGRSDLHFLLDLVKRTVSVTAVLIGVNYGVVGVAIAYTASSVLFLALNGAVISKVTAYRLASQVWDLGPSFVISAFVGLLAISLYSVIEVDTFEMAWCGAAVKLFIFTVLYSVALIVLKPSGVTDLFAVLRFIETRKS